MADLNPAGSHDGLIAQFTAMTGVGMVQVRPIFLDTFSEP